MAPLLLLFLHAGARADGPVIEHAARGCFVAERFPQLEARFADPDAISRARVRFRGETGPWYFVEMKRSGPAFTGVLPKPKKSLKKMGYYIEATDREFRENRTQEFAADVVPEPGMCADPKMMAGMATTASVLVGAPAGAAAVPVGFSSSGVASAASAATAGAASGGGGGGGIGTGAVLGIVAGGAAIAGVAVAAGGGDDGPITTTTVAAAVTATTTSTTLAPAPPATSPGAACPACYAGNWQAQATVTAVANPPLCGLRSSDVGKVQSFPVVVATDGTILNCPECSGRIDATGAFALSLAGDPPGSGLTCPAGQISGRCTSVTSCNGTGSQGGDLYNFVMSRPSP